MLRLFRPFIASDVLIAVAVGILALVLGLAAAWALPGPDERTWSLDAHERRAGLVFSSRVLFEREGSAWRVTVACEGVNPRTGASVVLDGAGTARQRGAKIAGTAGPLGSFEVDGKSIRFRNRDCASGPYNRGTGD